jgi:RNA polymerase sigma factor (TIGR02999 family)
MNDDSDITAFLARVAHGDDGALDALIPRVYATLRQLAHRQRAHEAAHTLETTALVHEAYLTLAKKSGLEFADRAHFYAYIGRVMRHLLVDRARRKRAQKRQVPDTATGGAAPESVDVLALNEALGKLAAMDARLAHAAELRLFAGLSSAEIAEVSGVAARTVERDWLKARAFLTACLQAE